MRSFLVLLILAAPGIADAALSDAEQSRIRWLVDQFRSADPVRRHTAQEHLQEYGERIVPFLQTLRGEDPELLRELRAMTRGVRKLKLHLVAPDGPHRLGGPFRLTVRLVNDSDNTYMLPMTLGPDPRGGIRSALEIVVADRRIALLQAAVAIPPGAMGGEDAWGQQLAQAGPYVLLGPGMQVGLTVTLEGEEVPFRRPGTVAVWASFANPTTYRWIGVTAPAGQGSQFLLALASDEVEVRATGRKAAELETMLASGDAARVAAALAELRIREDDEVLPVLRRRAREPALRLAAVRRLGAAGKEEDFGFLYGCTRDPELDIRRAAVAALAQYRTRKARSRLISLAQDHEMKLDAIRALRNHRHAATIDCFVRLLVLQHEEPAVAKEMLDALYEWTDKVVEYRESELRSFERWWTANRRTWIRSDPPPR